MSNKLILGQSGFDQLILGYETNASQIKTRGFRVAATETNGVIAGDLLAVTSLSQVYKKFAAAEDIVAGICLATNVKLDPRFPESSTDVVFNAGDKGAALIYGDVPVKLHGTAPTEGAKVYYDLTNKAFTATSTENVEIKGARFTGQTNGDITVIFVQYI